MCINYDKLKFKSYDVSLKLVAIIRTASWETLLWFNQKWELFTFPYVVPVDDDVVVPIWPHVFVVESNYVSQLVDDSPLVHATLSQGDFLTPTYHADMWITAAK